MSAAIATSHRSDAAPARASAAATLRMLAQYKQWANGLTYSQVMALPKGEALKQRQTRFGDMVHTLNHVFVVDDIFRHHLEGRKHSYTSRNTDTTPPVEELWTRVQEMDQWYVDQVDQWSDEDLATVVHFEFVGGGAGSMTREEIVLHVVNHATYHRGFVGDLMYQVPVMPASNDLPVFIRDAYQKAR
jgi:uncharacterized damage-inducible protein DinB